MAGSGQLEAATDHRAMQGCNHRNGTVLNALKRRVPHARVKQALPCIALAQFAQIKTGTKVFTFAIYYGSAHCGWQVLEHIAQRQNQSIVKCVTLGVAGQANDGNFILFAANFKMEVFSGHNFFRAGLYYGYKI